MSTVFIESRSLSGLGSAPMLDPVTSNLDPTLVRVSSGAGLVVSGLIGYGSYRLFKSKHPVWGTIVGLIAAIGVPGGVYGLATGKAPGTT